MRPPKRQASLHAQEACKRACLQDNLSLQRCYMKASNLAGAGRGLFAAMPILAGELITLYCTRYRPPRPDSNYVWQDGDSTLWDAKQERSKRALAKYANDPNGPTKGKAEANATIAMDSGLPKLYALHDIDQDEEIYVDYGDVYWKTSQPVYAV